MCRITVCNQMIPVRLATRDDAQQISEVLIRSITQLCDADHANDADALGVWTSNKSVTDILSWLEGPHRLLVSLHANQIAAVGMYSATGDILLLYVDPDHRGQGHSTALLRIMEDEMQTLGLRTARLDSTRVAREFYLGNGWEPDHAARPHTGLPMRKTLQPVD